MLSFPTPPRIVIGQNAHAAMRDLLLARRPELEIRGNVFTALTDADLEWADVYLGFKRPPTASMGNVRWVHCTGAGVDSWLLPDPLPAEIVLTRTPESFGPMIAEWALTRALVIQQQVLRLAANQQARQWDQCDIPMLKGTHAVVVGTGDVGTHIGRVFRGMGCEVSGVSRSGAGDKDVFGSMSTTADLARAAADADWLILTLPLTTETRGLVGREVLSACRGAVLLNAGRGAVVQEALIPEALEQGWLRAVALDVFEKEPLPENSPLWADPRVMISPHVSGLTTLAGAAEGFLQCLSAFEHGEVPRWVVDRDRGY